MISRFLNLKNNIHTNLSSEIEKNTQLIHTYIEKVFSIVEEMGNNPIFIDFLYSCTPDTCTVEHESFEIVLQELKTLFEKNDEIYLTFVSIKANEDSLDHSGRSRQWECREGIRERYLMSERSWYRETDKVHGKTTMTLPYRDTSGAYIISFTKAIIAEDGEIKGVVGFDIHLSKILRYIQTPYRYLIVASRGEILFDSKKASFSLYQDKFNLMMFINPNVYKSIMQNQCEKELTVFDDKKRWVYYQPIIKGKYYFIQISEKIKGEF